MPLEGGLRVYSEHTSPEFRYREFADLTVVIFTRDRHKSVERLLRSVASFPCHVLIVDNGIVPVPDTILAQKNPISYIHHTGDLGVSLQYAAESIATPFSCVVDDDGLLQLNGLLTAIRLLIENSSLIAVSGRVVEVSIIEDQATCLTFPAPKLVTVDSPDDAFSRLMGCARSLHTWHENFWYSLFRSEVLVKILNIVGEVDSNVSSSGVGFLFAPLFGHYLGEVGVINAVFTIRDTKLASHDQARHLLWTGDWLRNPKYKSEVDWLVAYICDQLSIEGASEVETEIFMDHWLSLAILQVHVTEPVVSKLLRPLRRAKRRMMSSSGADGDSLVTVRSLSIVDLAGRITGSGGFCPIGIGDTTWYVDDLARLMHALEVDNFDFVSRPRDFWSIQKGTARIVRNPAIGH